LTKHVLIIALLTGVSAFALTPSRRPETIALVGATLIHVDGRAPIMNATVLVQGRRIVSVGSAGDARVPRGATRVDVDGKFIIPGLWDMHTHLSKARASSLAVLVAHGVTSVRDMAGEHEELLRWRREIQAGRRIGPRMLIAGPYLESPSNVRRMRRAPVAQMALALTRLADTMLYGVGSRDPVTFLVVPVALIAAGAAACLFPARRAARVDPAETMQAE
jgi:imidazolonepropionase-like amidohydrolase